MCSMFTNVLGSIYRKHQETMVFTPKTMGVLQMFPQTHSWIFLLFFFSLPVQSTSFQAAARTSPKAKAKAKAKARLVP